MDPHMRLGMMEAHKDKPLPCTECGDDSEGWAEWSDGSGWICKPCCEADRLLDALRTHREEYRQGRIEFLTWVRARRIIMREAEMTPGATDRMLSLARPKGSGLEEE